MTKIPLELTIDELEWREQTQKDRLAKLVELEEDIKYAELNGASQEVLDNLRARFNMAALLNYLDLQAIVYLKLYKNYDVLVHLHELNGRVRIRNVSEL